VRRAILLLVGLGLAVILITQLMWVLVELFLATIPAAAMGPSVDRITAVAIPTRDAGSSAADATLLIRATSAGRSSRRAAPAGTHKGLS
jgi:hypothetical protein